MQCSNCQKENSDSNSFCISCGVDLTPPDEYSLPELAKQVQSLRREVKGLESALAKQGTSFKPLPNTVTSSIAPNLEGSAKPPASEKVLPGGNIPQFSSQLSRIKFDLLLGGNWLVRIGILSVVIGTGFYLKLALDNAWINEIHRIILGIFTGLALTLLAEFWKKKYPLYAQALSGGGIGILYLTIFAASALYGIIGLIPAVAILFLVSVSSAILALRYDSMALAIIGIVGAFGAPLMMSAASEGTESPATTGGNILVVYILIVDFGVILLSTFRNWRWFTLLAFVGSIVGLTAWHDEYGANSSLLIDQTAITLVFLSFVGATSLFHFIWKKVPNSLDYALMVLNATVYFSISYNIFDTYLYDNWIGVFTLLLSFFYFALTYISFIRNKEHQNLAFMLAGIAAVLLAISIPIQFEGPWITIGWATHGSVLFWLSYKLRIWQSKAMGLSIFVIMGYRLLAIETPLDTENFQVFLNSRVLAFATGIVSLSAVAYFLSKTKETDQPGSSETTPTGTDDQELFPTKNFGLSIIIETRILIPAFVIAANFLTIWVISAEILSTVDSDIIQVSTTTGEHIKSLALSLFWAIYASLVMAIGILHRNVTIRLAGLSLLGIPMLKLFLIDTWTLDDWYRVTSYMSLGSILLISGFLYQKYSTRIKEFLFESQQADEI